jgi:hypothetical protein
VPRQELEVAKERRTVPNKEGQRRNDDSITVSNNATDLKQKRPTSLNKDLPPRNQQDGASAQDSKELITERQQLSRNLLFEYLAAWSSPNSVALSSINTFYGSQVRFYGKDVNVRTLLDEKRRFVQRWPVREYLVSPGSVSVRCKSDADTCRVASLLNYIAHDPVRERKAKGSAGLELQISFSAGRPEIVEESSGKLGEGF